MAFAQADTLKSRTYIGLLVAQFLAAFNDQAIHASAMFYAINQKTLTEAQAISLMPILFYAPWAIFCTLAGYLADRFSKRHSLVFWKWAEVGITTVALAGFWLGSGPFKNPAGPWVVLSTVFLMGMHSAFFVPAKYGVMPEILSPHLLSKGNGFLESLSFLAVILGTVSGGILSYWFRDHEEVIGVILVTLAVIGAIASLLIRTMPAANPKRPFPKNPFAPLIANIRFLLRSRPLALTVLGIAFFTFVVAFMRATVYMLGESNVPRWTEFKTSVIVGMSALGIGLGSPLAGYLSGGKVELGLVPLGAVGMIVATVLASFTLGWLPGLIACIILIGFFTGFFIVPLFTLLQHRAPKTSKGDSIATSNFINVTGAIAASVLFFVLVFAAQRLSLAPQVEQRDLFTGKLTVLLTNVHGRPAYLEVQTEKGRIRAGERRRLDQYDTDEEEEDEATRIEVEEDLIDVLGRVKPGAEVTVSTYTLPVTKYRPKQVVYYKVRPAGQPMKAAYDNQPLPRFLFLGAAFMTLFTLILLRRQLPDFLTRALLWLRALGRYRVKVFGMHNLPGDGPVVLATNCDGIETCLQVLSATDRFTQFVVVDHPNGSRSSPLLRFLARRTSVAVLRPGSENGEWDQAAEKAERLLTRGNMVGLPANGDGSVPEVDRLLQRLQDKAAVIPVHCHPAGKGRVHVIIGPAVAPGTTADVVRQEIHRLPDSEHAADEHAAALAH